MNIFLFIGNSNITNKFEEEMLYEIEYGACIWRGGGYDHAWRGGRYDGKHKGGAQAQNDQKDDENRSQRWLCNAENDGVLKKEKSAIADFSFFFRLSRCQG